MLWHYYDDENDNEQDRAVGAFSTEENAERARAFVRDKPGFRDHPEGFYIQAATLNETLWEEGFMLDDGHIW
jgi:hypothetical protein